MSNLNQGHRERLRQRMLTEGLSNFADHELLELLLFNALPRKDTNKIAHALLDCFGTIENVLEASPQQLMTIDGISEAAACHLSAIKECLLRYKKNPKSPKRLDTISKIIKYAQETMGSSYHEKIELVYLDGSNTLLFKEVFTSNSIDHVSVDIKRIVTTALRVNASGVMMFHSHVTGACEPSQADISITRKLFFALASMNIMLLEHIIFNNKDEFYSFFQEGIMEKMENQYKFNIKKS